ncbi:MAG: DNA polymerase/3'-5' exonuclease PolX [Candidatus Thorarchaeota archaeon]
MKNFEIAKILYEIADLLEIKQVQFKPQAYRKAAQNVENLSEAIEVIYEKGELETIPGIGESIASKIKEFLETNHLKYLDELRKEFTPGLIELLKVEGIGPKIAMQLSKELGIKSIDELESAAKEGKIRAIKGFGLKKEENILHAIKLFKSSQERFLLGNIIPIVQEIESYMKNLEFITKIEVAGSIRRKKETIGDIDILVESRKPVDVIKHFVQYPKTNQILSQGEQRSSIVLNNGIQVDLRMINPESFGAGLLYFTGSKEHNIVLRDLARKNNWKLNEYGLFEQKDNSFLAGKTELELYKKLGLMYIEPELRENRGEIELALKNKLPNLIKPEDIKGDLHIHSNWSDGADSIESIAKTAINLGYQYIAICDHSIGLKFAGGLDEKQFQEQFKEIEQVNRHLDEITILAGVELNIDKEGNLDLSNSVLKDFDFVIASIHSGFKQVENQIMKRLSNAMHNDYVSAIGHPEGRIINKREAIHIDLSKLFKLATELGVLLEVNAFPDRLDLSDINCFKAREHNVNLYIGTDAHSVNQLQFMDCGVSVARRGWLEPQNLLNSLDLKDLLNLI